ncbi:MAG: hypothetical protein ACHRHE_15365 [Tepidisphaerales bacterium]
MGHETLAGDEFGDAIAIEIGQDDAVRLRPGGVDDVLFEGDLAVLADLLVPEDRMKSQW